MTEPLPWQGLSFDHARRVDSRGIYDFFWAVVENGSPALSLALPSDADRVQPLPKIRSLDIRYRGLGDREALVVALRDDEQVDLFANLCRDLVRAGEKGASIEDALQRTLQQTLRWHHLLRGGGSDRLSLEEQRGLIGELQLLRELVENIGPEAAIEAWKGPEDATKDFELHRLYIEVKARRGAARPSVQISSVDQLADVAGSEIVLAVYDVDAAVRPEGMTLTSHVRAADELFRTASIAAYTAWERLLTATGFEWDHDYEDRRWAVGMRRLFRVGDGFPRIGLPVHVGVQNVRYSIALDACVDFALEDEVFQGLVAETIAAEV